MHRHSEKEVKVIAAECAEGEEVPGMRTKKGSLPPYVTQPWEKMVAGTVEVLRKPSFLCSVPLGIASVPCGPSGGAAYVAACLHLQSLIDQGREDEVAGKNFLVIIHDGPNDYAERYQEFRMEDLNPGTAPSPREIIFGKKK